MVQFPALPADDPETISYQVQQKLAYARWNQTMTEDYEDQIRSFEAADYRDGWGVGQYPHYYKAAGRFLRLHAGSAPASSRRTRSGHGT